MVFRSSVCLSCFRHRCALLCSPPTSQRTTMPLATHGGDRGSVEDKTTRPSWVGPDSDAEEDQDDENPTTTTTTTTRIRRRRQTTTTVMTRTIRLALAAVAVGSLRSFLTDRRHRADGGGKSGSSSGIIVIALSSGPPVSDASGSSPSVSIQMEPPSSGKDDETAARNATTTSSASHVVTATAEEEYDDGVDDDEIGTSTSSSSSIATSSSMCSCLHSFSNRTCCARTVLRAHKFGHVLAAEWFDKLRRSDNLDLTLTIDPATLPSSSLEDTDYRHVVFVRNFTEAFVSGYLYHKSGRECWLDPDGYPNGKPMSRQFNLYWGAQIRIAQDRHPRFGPFPPKHNRSLCEYLADEAELDGMKVYVAFALERWYSGLKEYLEQTKTTRTVEGSSFGYRFYFVCLEDASDPRYAKDWYDAAMDHLYPGSARDGGGRYAHPYPQRPVAKAKGNAHNQHAAYHGSHATSHDPDLRQRLTRLVSELDRDVFDGRIAAVDAMIGCNGGSSGGGAGVGTARTAGSERVPH
jgi:hypothetical protein